MTEPGARTQKLGIVHEPESVDVMALVRVTVGRWPLVWLVDARTPVAERRLLGRFGEVLATDERPWDELVVALREHGVGGLTCFADDSLERLARLGAALGVVHNPASAARCLVDKLAERDALAAAGMPVPRYHGVDAATTSAQLAERLAGIAYPLVIKPALGTGGRDTVCVADLDAAVGALAELTARRPGARFVLEECLGPFPPVAVDGLGDYVSVELACVGGHPQLLAITGRMPLSPPFRESGHFIPAVLDATTAQAVLDSAIGAVSALGVVTGCLHVEIKLTAEGPRVLEANGRIGGGGIRDLLCALGASDPYLIAAELAMGGRPTVRAAPIDGPLYYTFALQPPLNRRARLVDGWRERVAALPGISEVVPHFEEHRATIEEGAYGYLALVSGVAADRAALVATHATCTALIERVSSAADRMPEQAGAPAAPAPHGA